MFACSIPLSAASSPPFRDPNAIYYSSFYDDIKDENVDFLYGDELIDVKVEEIYDTYLDALGDYISSEIVTPARYLLPVMGKVNKR